MAVLPIRIYPDPVLRVKCREVTEFDDRLRKLVRDMIETMHAAPGIGLAAPQVGVELRVAVLDLSVGEDPSQIHILVNPRIVHREGLEKTLVGNPDPRNFLEVLREQHNDRDVAAALRRLRATA